METPDTTDWDEATEAEVRQLAEIIGEWEGDEQLSVILGNFRRIVRDRNRLAAGATTMLGVCDMIESQVPVESKSISKALWAARDGLRSAIWRLGT